MTRRIQILLMLAALLGAAAPARAGHWWWSGGGAPGVVHLNKGHLPGISFFNNAVNGSATAFEHARGDWSTSAHMDVFNWANPGADIVGWDGYWGNTGWRGQTTLWGTWDGNHPQQFGTQLNLSYLPDYVQQRKTACHELGHATSGVFHDESRVGCMFSGAANPNIVQERRPSAHDFEHAGHLWNTLH